MVVPKTTKRVNVDDQHAPKIIFNKNVDYINMFNILYIVI